MLYVWCLDEEPEKLDIYSSGVLNTSDGLVVFNTLREALEWRFERIHVWTVGACILVACGDNGALSSWFHDKDAYAFWELSK